MDYIKKKLALLPTKPGCYLMKNIDNNIIYVGKAKNLKNRVSSYFRGAHNYKTTKLVSEIVDFDYITVNTEKESLILENNLIKKHNPKYNILLKDDKTYPYIEVVNKEIPEVKVVRTLTKTKKQKYLYGPYPNVSAARKVVELINRVFKTKKCASLPKKECLYYHLGECLGYCINKIDKDTMHKMREDIIKFLNGDISDVKQELSLKMQKYSEAQEYEKALEMRDMLKYLDETLAKQKVEIKDLYDIDCFGYYEDSLYITFQVFFVRGAKIVESYYKTLPLIDDPKETFESFIANFYQNKIVPKEILVPQIVDDNLIAEYLNTNVKVPMRGDKHDLILLANKNAKINQETKLELIKKDEKRTIEANESLKKLLNMSKLDRIELFDNSNLFGTNCVSAMVVFINGKCEKSEYRKYKVSFDKNDDYGAMREVIYRRYFRVLKDDLVRPDLVIVDGSIGQIKIAKDIIDSLNLNIKVVGLRKNNRHATEALVDLDNVYPVDKHSDLFNYLETMQNEVHNFAISYHKNLRSKSALSSILDNISGVGERRKKELIKKFKTITGIRDAKIEELMEVVPSSVALALHDALKNYDNN